MTELPFEDGFFDAAYATESLEHAVEIERAVSELCRVVKPGGRIAIIDKNAEQWGKLPTPNGSDGSPARASSGCFGAIAGRYQAGTSRIGKTWNPTGCSWRGWR